ncbi:MULTISPECIES: FAD-dependent monooxygenase [unclassified Rhodococcus (in: high G+C Gram-positive bacteria)]|uniref:FAD-dependent monooxygenase n=1 Tax=unclassified Rhodococcus (in: high G+C Gram-positive bacteria) TaxID=192944 RepID=UPI00163AF7A2|nr:MULTISPECIES: FAD-dependent monooxygenase [unclassified Rhodococcus (in: high G+C Gram-positive bacteria)]MBC2640553.1 FAD-dependent monooxygenase [Rhodococcus sp. 3A]MBC2894701.1 FAD-dependent monooxygenase [Rhodococcus sp. 4CII]
MPNRTVLISGASIAGPALAFWLGRCGHAVTVVERAPDLRLGGQAVDFKGEVHRKVLERMGILDEVYRRQTGKTDLLIVDERDRHLATIPGEFIGGDVEILRGDLTEILYERTAESCEYLFGDSVTALVDTESGVDVTFEKSDARRFDLVFGADGIHSAVRRHRFGPEEEFVRFLGYYYAVVGTTDSATDASTDRARATGLMYNEPGRMAVVGGPKAPELFVFASDKIEYDRRDTTQQKRLLTAAYADAGWRVPGLLAGLDDATEFYLDSIARVETGTYTAGRVALLGDAAYGNTLGGFGTGLALVGAYVLAGELAGADGDHRVAFGRYNEQMHRYAKIARKGNAGPFLAPKSAGRIKLRNATFKSRTLFGLMMKLTDSFATDIDLQDYPALLSARRPGNVDHP